MAIGSVNTVSTKMRRLKRLLEAAPSLALTPPAALDGRAGAYCRPRAQCRLAADNDREAILAWLGSKGDGVASSFTCTQRAYRKEAERFLL